MVLINKHPKLSCHMASMPINNRRLIKPVMLMCFCSAKFLLYGINIVPFSNDHNIVSSRICRFHYKPPVEFLDPFLQMSKKVVEDLNCCNIYTIKFYQKHHLPREFLSQELSSCGTDSLRLLSTRQHRKPSRACWLPTPIYLSRDTGMIARMPRLIFNRLKT